MLKNRGQLELIAEIGFVHGSSNLDVVMLRRKNDPISVAPRWWGWTSVLGCRIDDYDLATYGQGCQANVPSSY